MLSSDEISLSDKEEVTVVKIERDAEAQQNNKIYLKSSKNTTERIMYGKNKHFLHPLWQFWVHSSHHLGWMSIIISLTF